MELKLINEQILEALRNVNNERSINNKCEADRYMNKALELIGKHDKLVDKMDSVNYFDIQQKIKQKIKNKA